MESLYPLTHFLIKEISRKIPPRHTNDMKPLNGRAVAENFV